MPLLLLGGGGGGGVGGGTPATGFVRPDSITLEVGLSTTTYRDVLITADATVLALPLSETKWTLARDITGNGHHGTWNGNPLRGVTMGLPENALGATFFGTDYVEVPDDSGSGFTTLNLSLAAGDIDLTFLVKGVPNSATVRCLAHKQQGGSPTGNGWKAYVVNGNAGFFLRVSGSTLFDFVTSGALLADGQEHTIHMCYRTGASQAFIAIDGVTNVSVGGISTEPAVVGGNLRVGMFADGTGGFVGTMAYFSAGRSGDDTLGTRLQATRSPGWTDIWADVSSMESLQVHRAITGSQIHDVAADPGTMTFTLRNRNGSTLGYYSPGHANCRSGWEIGKPIRLAVTYGGTTYYRFRGTITSVKPAPGVRRSKTVRVVCDDYISVLMDEILAAPPVQVNQPSSTVWGVILDHSNRPPSAVSIGIGNETMPFALDKIGEDTSLYSEMFRTAQSEGFGRYYMRGDTTQGLVLTYEGRQVRQIDTGFDAEFNNTMASLEVDYDKSQVVNIVRLTVHPRALATASIAVLYSLPLNQTPIPIAPDATFELEGSYINPDLETEEIGATGIQSLTAVTDYTLGSTATGGIDLTGYARVVADLGASGFKATITNTHPSETAFLTKFSPRGQPIYHRKPYTVIKKDDASIRKHGPRPLNLDLAYSGNITSAGYIADLILSLFSQPVAVPTEMSIYPTQSNSMLAHALGRDLGDRISIAESLTALDAATGYYIQGLDFSIDRKRRMTCSWQLAPSLPTGAGIFDESAFDIDLVYGV